MAVVREAMEVQVAEEGRVVKAKVAEAEAETETVEKVGEAMVEVAEEVKEAAANKVRNHLMMPSNQSIQQGQHDQGTSSTSFQS
mmetsp:Transcript_13556/g.39256  ORF Transcript_13556/g.39256 Transcript_13556/m.39256 type:complete len:84 (-) Transcript_13556:510-761(-)